MQKVARISLLSSHKTTEGRGRCRILIRRTLETMNDMKTEFVSLIRVHYVS